LLVESTEYINNDITVTNQAVVSVLQVEPGADIYVQAYQNYEGNLESMSDVYLFYYLSDDCHYNDADIYLGENYSSIDAQNITELESKTLTIPVTTKPGIYFILFAADATDAVSERNEDNNIACAQINVYTTEQIKVYPNPTKGLIQFESYYSSISKLEIYNSLGQLVVEFIEPENSINISNLSQGLYILNFIDLNGKETAIKLFKN